MNRFEYNFLFILVTALLTDYKNILMANDFSYSTLINSIAKCDAKSIQRENKYINLNFMLENDFLKFLNPLFYYNYSNFLFLTDIVSEENNSFNDTNTKKHLMNNDIEYNSSKTTLLNDYILKKKNISNKQYIDNNNYLNRLSDKSVTKMS